jgi:FkbM family methyltransferase
LTEFEADLRRILTRYRGEYHLTALADEPGTATIQVDLKRLERSSLRERAEPEKPEGLVSSRIVPVTTLDALLQAHKWVPPFGLKLDTEGSEDAVIRGAREFLRHTQFVIAEVPVADRFRGGYTFADFIGLMDERGFRVCDFLEVGRNSDFDTSFADMVFRRADPLEGDPAAGGTPNQGARRA